MRVCPDCSAENEDDADFCAGCGSFLDWGSDSGPIAADRPGASRFEAAPARPAPAAPAAPDAGDHPAPAPVPAEPVSAPPADSATVHPVAALADPVGAPPAEARVDAASVPPAAPVAGASATVAPTAAPVPTPEPPPAAPSPPSPAATSQPSAPPTPERLATSHAGEEVEEPPAVDPLRNERMRRLVAKSGVLPLEPEPVAEIGAVPTAEQPTSPGIVPTAPPAPTAPTAPPATARAEPGSALSEEPASLASVIKIAERSGRTDLSSRLQASQAEIRRTGISVTIVGEFKKGKSNLVNALVNAEICPSDPVSATVAPIVVQHGDELAASVTYARDNRGPQPIDLEQLAEFASEIGNVDNHLGVGQFDVALPRRLLATGLTFIDTPGVGGLDSALGAATLAALESSDGVLFVTDCSQELTAPELSFLTGARERCDSVICVMTKLDLHQHARALADINRGHLARAGLDDVPLVIVSSVLHLLSLAQGDTDLERESGFGEVFELLHKRIWEPARRRGLAKAGHELVDLAEHLAMPIEAERRAMTSEEEAARTLADLAEVQDRVRQFRSTAARWQQRLHEGMQEVIGDLDHDLRTRLRVVGRTAEGRTESEDAADDLVFEAWLHKATIEAVVAHYEQIVARTSALADEVAEHFVAFDRNARFEVEGPAPTDRLAAVHVTREASMLKDGIIRRVITTTQGYSSGVVLASSVIGVVSPVLIWLPMLTLPIAGLMARRAFSDDRVRRRAARRQELKRLAGKYLDEIGFIVNKDSRDTVRRIHRQIRDHYSSRAEQLEQTLQQAVAAAERARSSRQNGEPMPDDLDVDSASLRQMRDTANRLVASAPLAS